jgi:hypothetical protein
MVPEQVKYTVLKHSKLTFPGNLFHHRDKQSVWMGRGWEGTKGRREAAA